MRCVDMLPVSQSGGSLNEIPLRGNLACSFGAGEAA